MKRTLVLAMVAWLMLPLAIQANTASEPWWKWGFEGDTAPGASGIPWLPATDPRFSPPATEYSNTTDGAWYQNTGGDETYALAWRLSDPMAWPYDVDTPVTVEVRFKVEGPNPTDPALPVGVIIMSPKQSGTQRTFYFYFADGWVSLGNSNVKGVQRWKLDTTEYRVYRITIDVTSQLSTAELYIDGDPAPTIISSSGAGDAGNARFLWGDHQSLSTGKTGGAFTLDYLRWTDALVPPAP